MECDQWLNHLKPQGDSILEVMFATCPQLYFMDGEHGDPLATSLLPPGNVAQNPYKNMNMQKLEHAKTQTYEKTNLWKDKPTKNKLMKTQTYVLPPVPLGKLSKKFWKNK